MVTVNEASPPGVSDHPGNRRTPQHWRPCLAGSQRPPLVKPVGFGHSLSGAARTLGRAACAGFASVLGMEGRLRCTPDLPQRIKQNCTFSWWRIHDSWLPYHQSHIQQRGCAGLTPPGAPMCVDMHTVFNWISHLQHRCCVLLHR